MSNDKALKACIEYVAANNEIEKLSLQIADCLSMCEGELGTLRTVHWSCDDQTHLHATYKNRKARDEYGLHDGSPDLLDECEYCKEADKLIQLRKQARKRLGIAKRAITVIGKGGKA